MPFVLLYLVVEIVALVALGSTIGVGATLLVLLASAVVGLWLARREGARAARALAEAVTNRRMAHAELTDGMLIAVAGLLIFVPGLVTDVAGLLLLVPPVRGIVRRRLVRAAEERSPHLRTARIRSTGPVVDGAVVDGAPGGPVVDPRGALADARILRGAGMDVTVVHSDRIDVTIVRGFGTERPTVGRPGKPPVFDGTVIDADVIDGTVVDADPVDGTEVEGTVVDRTTDDGAVVDGAVVDGTADGAVVDDAGSPVIDVETKRRPHTAGPTVENEAHRPAS